MAEVPQPSRLPDGRLLLQITDRTGGLVIGRAELGGEFNPDLDLTPFDALGAGVSRRHAALVQYHERLHILDLDSANGTYLNGRRVPPHVPMRLKHDDVVRLGSMLILISVVIE